MSTDDHGPLPNQDLVVRIIGEAVDAWFEVLDEHDYRRCNCFRENFVHRLIDQKIFVGFDKL